MIGTRLGPYEITAKLETWMTRSCMAQSNRASRALMRTAVDASVVVAALLSWHRGQRRTRPGARRST
ncbi:MAG TPA: hypothetical protein VNB06_01285 [Thermoanaerobaculia bacterium]|nr:hypothetical protein [Thermoanaerobaculia bacterium]